MNEASSKQAAVLPPDQVKLNSIQASRLSSLSSVNISEIKGRSVANLSEFLKWQIDPEWLFFRRVCGQVVRWDPVTGQYQPVPFATVHVMDTECDFLGYFPYQSKWSWLFPIFCREEQIAETVTDACGNFCVWVPRFDIEWVVRWRLQRICFPEIFVKPNLGQLLQSVGILPNGPDPAPQDFQNINISLDRLASITGRQTASQLLLAQKAASIGGSAAALNGLLQQKAFLNPVPPPTSPALTGLASQTKDTNSDALRSFVQGKSDREYRFDPSDFIGPFPIERCVLVPERELVPILEVPDITFWVTQDVNGDGEQETIYSDGYFDIGWQSGPLSDVTLHASPIARINSTGTCQVPPVGNCEFPQILFAGLMPAREPYIDTTANPTRGFALRPNPPHTDGEIRASVFPPSPTPDTPSNAPFMGTIQLYGCNQFENGAYYRLLYSYKGAPAVPFTNLDWYLDPFPGPGLPLHVVPDAQGWYPILATPDAWFPPDELLDWPTSDYPDGLYDITLQIGDSSKTIIYTTPTAVPFQVDNSTPAELIQSLSWRELPSGSWTIFPSLVCPIVERTAGSSIEFQVQYQVSASHLLKMDIGSSGCGGGTMQPSPEPNALPYQHWYTAPGDNNVTQTATFVLPGSASAGCYGFTLNGYSRAFNPSGGDPANPQATDWYYDATQLIWGQANLSVAVVDL
jgi:hypothetical protein